MNASIANLILQRIIDADLPWIDKTAGLTRAISFVKGKDKRTLPIACDVDDPLACEEGTVADLLPEEKYASVLFFEGESYPFRRTDRILGTTYTSRLRIVVWLNCSKLGGACNCGDAAARDIISVVESKRYSTPTLKQVKHTVVGGGPARGNDIFGRYTFDAARSQYLHFPFDFFALDVETEFRVMPGCADPLQAGDVTCWTPPVTGRKRYPKDFSCAELQDVTTGLTSEQLGAGCLDCTPSDPGGSSLFDIEVYLNGTLVDTHTGVDASVDNILNITLT